MIAEIIMPLTKRTAQILSTKLDQLKTIKWSDGESNTDTGFSELACKCCQEAWENIQSNYPLYSNLTLEAKPPDINIQFYLLQMVVAKGKIELKSGKGKGIPGSTIGKLDINEPVIACIRNELGLPYEFRYAQYYNCIGETAHDMFQDRTPRPFVNFQKIIIFHQLKNKDL